MTILKHEFKQGWKSFLIWTISIAFLVAICVLMFPEMKTEMDGVSDMFASMGSFTAAFGMDRLNFGTLTGFYSIECGNILGIGGAFFAALIGIFSLAKEEVDHTAEFLLSHPIRRDRVVIEKILAVLLQIVAMNLLVYIISIGSIVLVGETIPWKEVTLIHFAYMIMQMEIAGICFGISAYIGRGGMGVGLGLAAMMYALNIIRNISDSTKFLKYITPFSYTEGADIITNEKLQTSLVLLGIAYMVIAIIIGSIHYCKKDIR